MRFAVIGDLPEALPLLEAVNSSSHHRLTCACAEGELAVQLLRRGISCSTVASFDEAMGDAESEAIIIAIADVDASISAARRASQEDRHVIILPPDEVSTAYSFELHLLLDESQAGILPLTGRWYLEANPAEAVGTGSETLRQLRLTVPLSTQPAEQRRRELHAIDTMCGAGLTFSQVTGLDVAGMDGGLLNRTVSLAASQSSEQRVPPATIQFDADAGPSIALTLTSVGGHETHIPLSLPGVDNDAPLSDPERLLQHLTDRLLDKAACQVGMEQFSNTLELLDGLQRSLRRRRTIDVYFDGVSERAVFKTQMTAIGCGILAWVSFGLILFLIVAQVFDLPPTLLKIGRVIWIAPVVIFLLAQLLLPLARERGTKAGSQSVDETKK